MEDDAAAWQALALYDPDAAGAAERLATLRLLAARGATTDDLCRAVREGDLPGLAAGLWTRRARRSVREVAAEAGISVETARLILRAAGLGDPGLDEPRLVDSDAHTLALGGAAVELFGVEATLQFSRVLGAALASIAEAAMTNFGQNVAPALDAGGAGELARVRAIDTASQLLFDEVPRMMGEVFFHFCEDAMQRVAVAGAATTSDLTVGFLDLVGSTTLAEQLAPAELGPVLTRFEREATERVAAVGGHLVKTIGDEVMYVTTDAAASCALALELVEWVDADPTLPALRGGLAAGGLVRGYGDYYGPVVNTAARAVKLAPPATVWATEEVRRRAGAAMAFEPAGDHRPRGFDRAIAFYRVRRA